jgi:hypothetical protein
MMFTKKVSRLDDLAQQAADSQIDNAAAMAMLIGQAAAFGADPNVMIGLHDC